MKRVLSLVLALVMLAATAMTFVSCDKTGTTATPAGTAAATGTSTSGEIVVGLIGPYTGDTAQYGLAVLNGAKLYFDEVNAAGGINGKQIKVISYDSKGDPTEASTAYTRLLNDGICAFLGGVLTGETLAIVPDAFEGKMPMISASATADAVTVNPDDQSIYTNVFRSCFIDSFQGVKMADYASEKLGATKAAVIYRTGDDYSEGLAEAFVAECAAKGITVTDNVAYSKGDVDFKSQLTTINAKAPDVVFCPNYYEDVGMIVTQAREVGYKGTFLGGDGWGGVTEYASAEDLEGSCYASGFDSSATAVVKFKADYVAKYGEDAPFNMFAALAYDAAKIVVNAITVADNDGTYTSYTSAEFKAAVVDAIKNKSTTVEGLTSNGYSFDAKNNPIKSVTIVKCVNGEEVSQGLY